MFFDPKKVGPPPRLNLGKNLYHMKNEEIEEMQKTSILVILGQKGQFWTVFGQNGKTGENFQKALGTFFSHLQALTNCKVS